jgi:pyruvate/2-oxoglutarate dehydrogenase complex dihydrolipoamide acyltransferase (E2) component
MSRFIEKLFLPVAAASLATLVVPVVAGAQEHVVSPAELRQDLAASARIRAENVARLDRVLATPAARQAMREAGVDYNTVQKGVPMLSDAQVTRLAARAEKAQADFAAGSISWAELLIVLIAVIVIIVIVAAV